MVLPVFIPGNVHRCICKGFNNPASYKGGQLIAGTYHIRLLPVAGLESMVLPVAKLMWSPGPAKKYSNT